MAGSTPRLTVTLGGPRSALEIASKFSSNRAQDFHPAPLVVCDFPGAQLGKSKIRALPGENQH